MHLSAKKEWRNFNRRAAALRLFQTYSTDQCNVTHRGAQVDGWKRVGSNDGGVTYLHSQTTAHCVDQTDRGSVYLCRKVVIGIRSYHKRCELTQPIAYMSTGGFTGLICDCVRRARGRAEELPVATGLSIRRAVEQK